MTRLVGLARLLIVTVALCGGYLAAPRPAPVIPANSLGSVIPRVGVEPDQERTGAPTAQGTRAETAVRFPSQYPRGEHVSPGAPLIALGQGALATGHASMCDNSGVGVSDENPYHG